MQSQNDNQSDPQNNTLEQLQILNIKLENMLSLKRNLVTGIAYGVGFVLGSAIIATILIGVAGPIVQKISWIHEWFIAGKEIIKN